MHWRSEARDQHPLLSAPGRYGDYRDGAVQTVRRRMRSSNAISPRLYRRSMSDEALTRSFVLTDLMVSGVSAGAVASASRSRSSQVGIRNAAANALARCSMANGAHGPDAMASSSP